VESDRLQKHILATYCGLRIGLAFLAFAFPVILVFVGSRYGIPIQQSMSAYYFAFDPPTSELRAFPMRTWFVGILFAIGAFLVLYRGYSKTEDRLLDIAGICALLVALFPMAVPDFCANCGDSVLSWIHYASAVILFVCVAYVALTCSQETLARLPQGSRKRKVYRVLYDIIALFMIVLPALSFVFAFLFGWSHWSVLAVEWGAIYAFGAYWLAKSWELCIDRDGKRMDEMAVTGRMPTVTMKADTAESATDAERLRLGRVLD
jgi:hypothetical protein